MNDIATKHAFKMATNTSAKAKIGLLSMMAICIGMVIVQGAMISSLQGIALGGMSFIFAMIAALIIAQFNAMSFAELSLMFPQEGTLATYTQQAIGHFPAIVSVFAGYVVVAILAVPVELFLVDAMIGELLPGLVPEKVIPLAIIVVLVITNLIGADIFAKVQNLLAFVMICALVLTGIMAITHGGSSVTTSDIDWSFHGVFDGSFVGLIALAMWLFVGAEYICPMINEVKDPVKSIPRAMRLSLFAIFAIFITFAYGATLFLNTETLLNSPIPYLDYATAVFGKEGLMVATVMALAATCSTVNTIFAALPRMLHGMAENKQAFPQLKALNRFDVPWVGVVMMAVLIAITFMLMSIDSLIVFVIAATTSYLLAYIIAHINVMVLRKRLPAFNRPYKTPFYPLPQIVGIVAMIYIALNNSPSPDMTKMVYGISGGMLLVIGIISAVWVKFYMKRNLFEPDMS